MVMSLWPRFLAHPVVIDINVIIFHLCEGILKRCL